MYRSKDFQQAYNSLPRCWAIWAIPLPNGEPERITVFYGEACHFFKKVPCPFFYYQLADTQKYSQIWMLYDFIHVKVCAPIIITSRKTMETLIC